MGRPYFLHQVAKKNPGYQYYQQPGKGKGMTGNRCNEYVPALQVTCRTRLLMYYVRYNVEGVKSIFQGIKMLTAFPFCPENLLLHSKKNNIKIVYYRLRSNLKNINT